MTATLSSGSRRQKALRERRRWPAEFLLAEKLLVKQVAGGQEDPVRALERITDWPASHRDYRFCGERVAA
jgi:hypothetical protein